MAGAPAALSVNLDDPRFAPDWQDYAGRLVIELCGEVQRDVVTYDTGQGMIVRLVQQDGRYVLNGDEIATETVRGVVTVWLRA